MEKENRSFRGMLVEMIVKSFVNLNSFSFMKHELKVKLQEKLNSNLIFKTEVSEIETKNGHTFGQVSFEDENGSYRAVDFTITGKSEFAVYEKEPAHGKDEDGVILAPFNTKEEAEQAGIKYGYDDDNYYVDKIK